MSLAALVPLLGAGGARVGGRALRVARFHTSPIRKYSWLSFLLGDWATKRFTKYSKVFTVDGNLCVNKGKFAQQIAEQLGLRYFPEVDLHYVDKVSGYGTCLDPAFIGNCSLEAFYDNPKNPDGNAYRLQAYLFTCRVLQYADALEHLFNTGQGVILERSPFSDFVFLEAMSQQGYIRKECVSHYNKIKEYSIYRFLPPHLVFYIDVPVSEVLKRIEEKGEPYEKKVSPAYLQSIEDVYKKSFLPQISEVSEVLQYTASRAEDLEIVLEEIELLEFKKGPWPDQTDGSLHDLRMLVENKMQVLIPTSLPFHIKELTMSGTLADQIYFAWKSFPGHRYARGYNADAGDKWIWLK
uniref:NADH dehydrogenase [ubiquinone] 1 alpha subcomplex subunit 10, mitochondrial n=1 Tax=Pogona vitticeps TaxID=103695 RepID=A0ABM5EQ19_9SAUR